jgi:hypothetical protein
VPLSNSIAGHELEQLKIESDNGLQAETSGQNRAQVTRLVLVISRSSS